MSLSPLGRKKSARVLDLIIWLTAYDSKLWHCCDHGRCLKLTFDNGFGIKIFEDKYMIESLASIKPIDGRWVFDGKL